MPAIFGDHMVLQRDGMVPLWGTADPGETVTVTAGAAKGTATADTAGKWVVKLSNLPASTTPIDVTVAGKNTLTFHDVLVGDVWVCSGQSNMEFGIKAFMKKEDLEKTANPLIRLFMVPKLVAPNPAGDIGPAPAMAPKIGHWMVCSPETLAQGGEWSGFPAVAYYFGREVQAFTNQPVGLIGSCWGGTRINSWTSLEALQSNPAMASLAKGAADFRDHYDQIKTTYETTTLPQWNATLAKWNEDNKAALDAYTQAQKEWGEAAKTAAANHQPAPPRPVPPKPPRGPVDPVHSNQTSTGLYNGMIAPLIPYGIKGVVWYQGEANGDQPDFYRIALPLLINDWRKNWNQGDFPFLVVQLPNFMQRKPAPSESTWAGVREAQADALSLPNTGVAVTIDLGEAGNIHPADKQDVGQRLGLVARHVAYGQKDDVYTGPTFKSSAVEGNKIRLTFDNVGGGLVIGKAPDYFYSVEKNPPAPELSKLEGFAIAGADGKYVWANATIDGSTVVVSADEVTAPVNVRYAWADNPACNLYNKEGLPAAPFRTDTPPAK
jgi:sialate O-acetylesterase